MNSGDGFGVLANAIDSTTRSLDGESNRIIIGALAVALRCKET